MTDKEIIKAFGCCNLSKCGGCKECPCQTEKNSCLVSKQEINLEQEVFDLINRQQAEIEALIAGRQAKIYPSVIREDRITGRLDDGTVFIHSETGEEGVGTLTTKRRLPEICCKLAKLEDKIENGELVEVVHGVWNYALLDDLPYKDEDYDYKMQCSVCGGTTLGKPKYCQHCGAKMEVLR